jgi:hypothetical protein
MPGHLCLHTSHAQLCCIIQQPDSLHQLRVLYYTVLYCTVLYCQDVSSQPCNSAVVSHRVTLQGCTSQLLYTTRLHSSSRPVHAQQAHDHVLIKISTKAKSVTVISPLILHWQRFPSSHQRPALVIYTHEPRLHIQSHTCAKTHSVLALECIFKLALRCASAVCVSADMYTWQTLELYPTTTTTLCYNVSRHASNRCQTPK